MTDTIPAPPSWVPQSIARRWVPVVLIAMLGTSGCGGVVAGVAQLVSAVNAGNAQVAQRLMVIEGKLDRMRDDLAEARAVGGVNRGRLDAVESNMRGVEVRLSNVER